MEIELNTERFLALLEKFIGESQYVQNMPPQYIPQESRVINHILPLFEPHLAPNGPITLQVSFSAAALGLGVCVRHETSEGNHDPRFAVACCLRRGSR